MTSVDKNATILCGIEERTTAIKISIYNTSIWYLK